MSRSCKHEPSKTRLINFHDIHRSFPDRTFEVPDTHDWYIRGKCAYDICVELLCPICGCVRGGWGLMGCPCDDYWPCHGYKDMRKKPHAAVKPSTAGRKRHTNTKRD